MGNRVNDEEFVKNVRSYVVQCHSRIRIPDAGVAGPTPCGTSEHDVRLFVRAALRLWESDPAHVGEPDSNPPGT
ncbi:MAG: hypothetical protein ACREJC_07925, partial [Tepidisphaeraceae bacterium]